MNKIQIQGNLTKDIEIKHVGTKDTAMTSFNIAVNDNGKTAFVWFTAWGKMAERIGSCKKGQAVKFVAHFETSSKEENGKKSFFENKIVDNIEIVQTTANEPNIGF